MRESEQLVTFIEFFLICFDNVIKDVFHLLFNTFMKLLMVNEYSQNASKKLNCLCVCVNSIVGVNITVS